MKIFSNILFISICLGLVVILSQGKVLLDVWKHPFVHGLSIAIAAYFGLKISKRTLIQQSIAQRIKLGILTGLYFLFLAINFSDGHAGGWSASDSVVDKVFFIFISSWIATFSGIALIPLLLGIFYQGLIGYLQTKFKA